MVQAGTKTRLRRGRLRCIQDHRQFEPDPNVRDGPALRLRLRRAGAKGHRPGREPRARAACASEAPRTKGRDPERGTKNTQSRSRRTARYRHMAFVSTRPPRSWGVWPKTSPKRRWMLPDCRSPSGRQTTVQLDAMAADSNPSRFIPVSVSHPWPGLSPRNCTEFSATSAYSSWGARRDCEGLRKALFLLRYLFPLSGYRWRRVWRPAITTTSSNSAAGCCESLRTLATCAKDHSGHSTASAASPTAIARSRVRRDTAHTGC